MGTGKRVLFMHYIIFKSELTAKSQKIQEGPDKDLPCRQRYKDQIIIFFNSEPSPSDWQ